MKHPAPASRVIAVIISPETIKVTHDTNVSELQTAADLLAASLAVMPNSHYAMRAVIRTAADILAGAIADALATAEPADH